MLRAIKAAMLIDGTGREAIKDPVVLIKDEKILEVGSATQVPIPSEAKVTSYPTACILPGFIDCHYHPAYCSWLGYEEDQYKAPDAELGMRALLNIQKSLKAGTTTVRVVGEKNYIDYDCKNAIESGLYEGPRILTSGPGITATGGHAYCVAMVADGPQEIRKAVRTRLEKKAHTIKMFYSGGTGTLGSVVTRSYYTKEEVEASIDEAHLGGATITAHLHGGVSLKWAVGYGIDSVEHGAYLTKEDLDLMAKAGTWLVPTLSISFFEPGKSDVPQPEELMQKKAKAQAARRKMFPMAISTGVKIAAGTDALHGEMAFEAKLMVDLGYKPMQAIVAATSNAAELCRIKDNYGTIERGKTADIWAVLGDPLKDINKLREVVFVMKGGKEIEI